MDTPRTHEKFDGKNQKAFEQSARDGLQIFRKFEILSC